MNMRSQNTSGFQIGVPPAVRMGALPLRRDEGPDSLYGPLVMPAWKGAPMKFERRVLSRREALFAQGDPSAQAYFVESGVIQMSHQTVDGFRNVVGFRANGCILDAAGLALNIPHWCTAEALTRTVVAIVPAAALRSALEADRELLREFNSHLIREIACLEDHEVSLRRRSVDERFGQLLNEFRGSLTALADATKASVKQRDVASMLGITPSHLSRLIRRTPSAGKPGSDRRN